MKRKVKVVFMILFFIGIMIFSGIKVNSEEQEKLKINISKDIEEEIKRIEKKNIILEGKNEILKEKNRFFKEKIKILSKNCVSIKEIKKRHKPFIGLDIGSFLFNKEIYPFIGFSFGLIFE